MANNNSNFNGAYKGFKVKVKLNKRVLSGALALLMTLPVTACFKNDDSNKEQVKEETETVEILDENDINNNPTEEIEIVDSYMDYIEKIDTNDLTKNSGEIRDKIMNKYDELKTKYEGSSLKDKVDEQKEEFLYSVDEILNMAEGLKTKEGEEPVVPYEEYKEEHEEEITAQNEGEQEATPEEEASTPYEEFEMPNESNEKTNDTSIEEKKEQINRLDKVFEYLRKFQNMTGGFMNTTFEEYDKIKEKYDIDMSDPTLSDEQVNAMMDDYITECENLLAKVNVWLKEKGLKPIPASGNLFEDTSYTNQTPGGKRLVKTEKN